jgi:hypothetical protein
MRSRTLVLALSLALQVAPASGHDIPLRASQRNRIEVERAWPAFFAKFRHAVHRRDRKALQEMLVKDFYFSGGGGDDNHDGDLRDDASKFWDDNKGWEAFDRTLAKGTAPTARWWDDSGKRFPGRIAPPAANVRRNTAGPRPKIDWLAFFEFRNGRWYCTSFSECCD